MARRTFEGIDVGSGIAELGGIESLPLKAAGTLAGGVGMLLDIREANQKLGSKWEKEQQATTNDFVPYALPLLMLTPVGETVLVGVGAYNLLSRQQTTDESPVDPDAAWHQGIQDQIDAARKSNEAAEATEVARLGQFYSSKDLGNIDPNNYHTDSFSVDGGPGTPPASGAESGWELVGRYTLQDQQMHYETVQPLCIASPSFADFVQQMHGTTPACRVLVNEHTDVSSKLLVNCPVYTDFGNTWSRDLWEDKLNPDQSIEITQSSDFVLLDQRTMQVIERDVYQQCQVQPVDCSDQGKASIAAKYDASVADAMCAN